MPRNYLPGSDAGLLDWSRNFANRIAAGPGVYGLTAGDAAGYAAAQGAYASAYRLAREPLTRGGHAVSVKNRERKALVAASRRLARVVMARPGVSDAQRVALGLNPRRVSRRRVPAPEARPVVYVSGVNGSRVRLRLDNPEAPARRGRPVDVMAAVVFYFVGDQPPAKLADWAYCRATNRTRLEVVLSPSLRPGEAVWLTACWTNARGERGPLATPVRTMIGWGALALPVLRAA